MWNIYHTEFHYPTLRDSKAAATSEVVTAGRRIGIISGRGKGKSKIVPALN
jgi:hypothetical protein